VPKTVAPYGSWPSPVSIERSAGTGDPWFGWVVVDFDDDGIVWIEPRPAEGGRAVLVLRRPDGSRLELTPPGFDVRTGVHDTVAARRGGTQSVLLLELPATAACTASTAAAIHVR
jgi:hypothetical protein